MSPSPTGKQPVVSGNVSSFVITTDAFGGHGGIAKYNRDLLRALCSHAAGRVLALPRIAEGAIEPLPSNLIYSLDGLGGKGRFTAALISQLAKVRTTDLVVCGHINLLPLALLAKARFRKPLTLFIYGIDAWTAPSRAARALIGQVDAVVSISQTTLDRFQKWAAFDSQRCHVLPNAFDPSEFGAAPKPDFLLARYPALVGKRVLMTFGRMAAEEAYKGFDEVMGVMPSLLGDFPDLVYLLVGDGSDRQRLEDKARRLGLSSRVVFTGRIAESEKADHYRLADAYVMPGHGEGFGFVLLEAMACGIPAVASSADGSREAVRDGLLGLVVDPRDPDDIRRGIAQALHRQRGAVPPGLDYFSYANFERRTHGLLDQIITRQSGR